MAVALILPVHNAERFLIRTLYSIHEALNPFDQLVVIFDSCTDRSEEVFDAWKKLTLDHIAYEITVFAGSLGGIAEARNKGLELCDRDWVSFIDHDDMVVSSIYRDLLNAAVSAEADVARSGYVKRFPTHDEIVYPDLAPEYYAFFGIFIWNSLFERRLIEDNKVRFVKGYGEDYEFNLQIARYSRGQAFVKKPLYHWKIHGANHHLARRPKDFAERAQGLFERNSDYLLKSPNAGAAFGRWLREYIVHLRSQFGESEVEAALTEFGTKEILLNMQTLELR